MYNSKDENIFELFDSQSSSHNRNKTIKIVIIIIMLLSLVFLLQRETLEESPQIDGKERVDYLVYNEGCQISNVVPTSSEYFGRPLVDRCTYKGNINHLVSSDDKFIWVNEENLNKTDYQNINCCYTDMSIPIDSTGCNDKCNLNSVCVPFWNKTEVTAEFLKVLCLKNGKMFYIDFHIFTPRKKYVDDRCATLSKSADKLNVLILGFDSISRAHFHRAMNKTADYLINNLSAVEMVGYNKIAENTYPNLLTAFSGRSYHELTDNCAHTRDSFLDGCQFIWDDYKASGYRTALTEELWYSFTLRQNKPGFCKSPTDYYSSHYFQVARRETSRVIVGRYCYGIRWKHEMFLAFVGKFVRSSNKYPFFGFFFEDSFTHEDLNNGYLLDDAYYSYIEELSRHKSFNKTVLIFLSDHGFQAHQKYMATEAGLMESKLPLMSFVFPAWFRQKYSTAVNNIEENVHRLTTPFDFHETLKDLLDYPEKLNEAALEKREGNLSTDPLPRAISLFLRIPERRTCEDAGIPWHYCACHQDNKVDVRSPMIQYLCEQAIIYINSKIEFYPQCVKFSLNKVINAAITRSIVGSARGNGSFGHRATFTTTPGTAMFMVTALNVENKFKEGANVNNSFDFIEAVSRMDVYKEHSSCVDEYKVQRFCYCG